jgi:5-methylcytosine-specific restriction enzyme subunit McrC
MLSYLYDELRSRKFQNFDTTDIKTVDDLYATVICKWCSAIAHEGLYKEYVVVEDDELSSPKGQINVQASISQNTRSRGTLICSYDELSADIYINHILKGAVQDIIFDSSIDPDIKVEAQKTLMLFNGVSFTDINQVHWKDIKYNNNTARYKNLIEVIRNLILEKKMIKQGFLDEDTRTYQLFKRQLFKWVKVNYGKEDYVEAFETPFNLGNEPLFEYKINKTQKLIVIRTDEKALVLCVRLQTKELLDDSALGRKHMEELVESMREYVKEHKVKVAGCIIYVNTDKTKLNLQPITVNVVNDYTVGEQVIDIHDQWRFIANKINTCYKMFIERAKKMSKGKAIDDDNEDTDD